MISQSLNFPDLNGYRKLTDFPVYTTGNLRDFMGGAADLYLSFEFIDLQMAEYKKGKNIIRLEVYRFKDNIQAFGIYSSERSSGFQFLNIGSQGYESGGVLNFLKGSYYVKLRTISKSEKVIRALRTLGFRVSSILTGVPVMPAVLGEFPENGKLKNEEIFICNNVLGHEFLKDAFKAHYEIPGANFEIYISNMESTEECRDVVSKYLEKTGGELDDPSGGKYFFKDGYNGDIFLAWKNNRIVIISGLAMDQADIAERYTSEILK